MLVKDKMQTNPITIRKDDSLRSAADLIKEKRVRTLPVVESGKLIGVVTDRDVRLSWASSATSLEVREIYYLLEEVRVKEIMTINVITVTPDTSIKNAARLIHDKNIGALPVVNEKNELVGILTETDIIEILLEVMSNEYG